MEVNLYNRSRVFILGAGASIDYGLPVWKDLDGLIRKEIEKDKGSNYKYSKEIIAWMDKVGAEKEYKTIDDCIAHESVQGDYHSNGDEIENEIFDVMRNIFSSSYKDNANGWIRVLSDKILSNPEKVSEENISFINYNYDMVLEKNFLKFNHLPGKHRRLNHRGRLETVSQAISRALYPHGNLYEDSELPKDSQIQRFFKTMKSEVDGYIDAVSCHESFKHRISHNSHIDKIKLYILGLGGGLRSNLEKITFNHAVSEIHVTVRDEGIRKQILEFLSKKFGIPLENIKVYSSCEELVKGAF